MIILVVDSWYAPYLHQWLPPATAQSNTCAAWDTWSALQESANYAEKRGLLIRVMISSNAKPTLLITDCWLTIVPFGFFSLNPDHKWQQCNIYAVPRIICKQNTTKVRWIRKIWTASMAFNYINKFGHYF